MEVEEPAPPAYNDNVFLIDCPLFFESQQQQHPPSPSTEHSTYSQGIPVGPPGFHMTGDQQLEEQ